MIGEENIIDRRVREFVPAVQALLVEKTDSAAASAQKKLNAVWDIVFTLPVYRELRLDAENNYHTFKRLLADEAKLAQVQDPASEGHPLYQGMILLRTEFYRGLAVGNTPPPLP